MFGLGNMNREFDGGKRSQLERMVLLFEIGRLNLYTRGVRKLVNFVWENFGGGCVEGETSLSKMAAGLC